MTPEAAQALEESIAHWRRNVEAETPDQTSVYSRDCALCRLFFLAKRIDGKCTGCPVFAVTKLKFCAGSPYQRANKARSMWWGNIEKRDAWRDAARAELSFLESLRETT